VANLENTTPFGALAVPSADREGRDLLLIIVAARFLIPEPPETQLGVLPLDRQLPPPLTDSYTGEPGGSSLRVEGQTTYVRPATDIYIWGEACAPHGHRVERLEVRAQVGPCKTRLTVIGDRIWLASPAMGAMASRPRSFLRIPLIWERAFGGVAAGSTQEKPLFEPRNPVGCGFESDAETALGRALPNIESVDHPLRRPGDRPPPVGLGPIARSWQPRLSFAGTYDETWRRERAPLWPDDFDERFFNAAPDWLQARPHLVGGEAVRLDGMHAAGTIKFQLPVLRFVVRSRFTDRELSLPLQLDGVMIDTVDRELALYFRAAVPAPLGLIKHRRTILRLLQRWEPQPARELAPNQP
jgi:hypothetical protein